MCDEATDKLHAILCFVNRISAVYRSRFCCLTLLYCVWDVGCSLEVRKKFLSHFGSRGACCCKAWPYLYMRLENVIHWVGRCLHCDVSSSCCNVRICKDRILSTLSISVSLRLNTVSVTYSVYNQNFKYLSQRWFVSFIT